MRYTEANLEAEKQRRAGSAEHVNRKNALTLLRTSNSIESLVANQAAMDIMLQYCANDDERARLTGALQRRCAGPSEELRRAVGTVMEAAQRATAAMQQLHETPAAPS